MINATENDIVGLSCIDSKSYRNPYNNFTCAEHKTKCMAWGQILSLDEFTELQNSCRMTCNTCWNTSLSSISSFVKNNEGSANALRSTELSTVVVLSTFGFVAISAIFVGLLVIHKRSSSFDRQENVLFREFHSEDALDSDKSVCGSSEVASSKSSSQPSSELGVVLDIESSTSSSVVSSGTSRTIYQNDMQKQISLPGDVISPINGFDIPASPCHLDIKCFTYIKQQSSGTTSTKDVKRDNLTKSSSTDSGDGEAPKVVHLLGYALSASSDGLEYCTTASSSEDV